MLLLNGDCIEQMQKLIDEGVQVESVVTDPPYELGFMGKSWDASGIAFDKKTWELAFQLLKPGGYLLAFSASRNYHRMAVAVEDAGFEIRDQIMWIYGSGFPKSLNIGMGVDKKQGNERVTVGERTRNVKPFDDDNGWNSNNTTGNHIYTKGNTEWEGWGTALKPAHEPIVMARKPLEGTVVDNVLEHGVGGINIDGCRIDADSNAKSRVRKAGSEFGQNSGWNDHQNVDTVYDPSKGRFPANVMHDGLQEDWARYFYCPKTAKSERNQGLVEFDDKQYSHDGRKKSIENPYQRNKSISKNNHPTVKPQELMKYLCRLVTPKGGTVLDPFMGSGSTGMAAKDEGFDFIGIEREKEYFEISEQRIKTTAPLSEFFA